MKTIHFPIKHSPLNNFIHQIILFRYDMDNGKPISPIPFPPQPINCLYFYPYHRVHCYNHANQKKELLPHSTFIGPQLSRVDLTMGYKMLVIIVMFKPGGMYRLLGIPMHELLDEPFGTELLFGREIETIIEQLNETLDFEEMLRIVHDFLCKKASKLKQVLPLENALDHLINSDNPIRVDQLASEACVSVRQLERQFKERIGMPPKEYTRLVRFSKAWVLKEKNNDISWVKIAHECHYADQMHLIRDFKEFAGVTPTLLASAMEKGDLRLQGNTF